MPARKHATILIALLLFLLLFCISFFLICNHRVTFKEEAKKSVWYGFSVQNRSLFDKNSWDHEKVFVDYFYFSSDNGDSILIAFPQKKQIEKDHGSGQARPSQNDTKCPKWILEYYSDNDMADAFFLDFPNNSFYHGSQYVSELPPFNNRVYVLGDDLCFHETNLTAEFVMRYYTLYSPANWYRPDIISNKVQPKDMTAIEWHAPDFSESNIFRAMSEVALEYAFSEDYVIYLSKEKIARCTNSEKHPELLTEFFQELPRLSEASEKGMIVQLHVIEPYDKAPEAKWNVFPLEERPESAWKEENIDMLIDGMGEEPDEIIILDE